MTEIFANDYLLEDLKVRKNVIKVTRTKFIDANA
jgi:hypothetical protein